MQVYRMFSIYDKKSGSYMRPFFGLNSASVVRDLVHTLPKDNVVALAPEDFSLWELGAFNDEDGSFDVYGKHVFVSNFSDLFKKESSV